MQSDALPAALVTALSHAQLTWDELVACASDIVLFGSRACGLGREGSDWDLVCVGRGPVRPRSGVDIVWVGPRTVMSPRWLGSELAGHVVAFGRPLVGSCEWMGDVRLSPDALRRKQRRILTRVSGLTGLWGLVRPGFQRRHGTLLRRELQRAALLAEGRPVPPAALLDTAWAHSASTTDRGAQLTNWMSPEESATALLLLPEEE
jgi:Nucleotidyltransferase domain